MSAPLVIPDNAVKYILFQRTAYLRLPVTLLYRHFFKLLPFSTPLYNLAVAIESRVGRERVKRLYAQDMEQEYQSIRSVLPQVSSAVLDVGCGVAGIDVYIYRHYVRQSIDFYLLDRSQIDKRVYYLHTARGSFYNSLDVAHDLLTENGIPPDQIHLLEATDTYAINVYTDIDLVVSLLSWGFHYPVQTYVDRVRNILSDDGVVILDVRKGTDGIQALQQRFSDLIVIRETVKYQRVVARK